MPIQYGVPEPQQQLELVQLRDTYIYIYIYKVADWSSKMFSKNFIVNQPRVGSLARQVYPNSCHHYTKS